MYLLKSCDEFFLNPLCLKTFCLKYASKIIEKVLILLNVNKHGLKYSMCLKLMSLCLHLMRYVSYATDLIDLIHLLVKLNLPRYMEAFSRIQRNQTNSKICGNDSDLRRTPSSL